MNVKRIPYTMLASLLYAGFDFLERESNLVVVPTSSFCRQLSITTSQMKESLQFLEESNLIQDFKWYKHYANVRLKAPVGMYIHREDLDDCDTEEG